MAAAPFLPTTREEIASLGWDGVDVVLVSGDAYVDHPSFAAAILGRVLEANGFRVAILPQPDWKSPAAWRALGRPRLFYGVSAGNMDSMINHYTANRKRRNDDAYSPGGRIHLRPDRPTAVYAQRCREAFPGVPVIAGGVEASLRRIAHYDWWSDTVRPSILVPSKADLLVHGMGEKPILAIARRLAAGEPVAALRDLRGVAYLLGRTESLPDHPFTDAAGDGRTIELPSFEDAAKDKTLFARMTALHHHETNPLNARRVVQRHGDRVVVQNPPTLPLSEAEMDAAYDLPYARLPHPRYREPIPAFEMIRDSVTILRGCFGGCTFCSITMHQGRIVTNRSEKSVIAEVERIASRKGFSGVVSDLGGPTANMYRMRCTKPAVEAVCRRQSCVHPTICPLLGTDHGPTIGLLAKARAVKGVRKVLVASGIRMDLAERDPAYVLEMAKHHVGGHLKVAPEHVSAPVLAAMKKPSRDSFERFAALFRKASARAGKEQYLVPYFIAGHPGSTEREMIDLAVYLKQAGYRPRQVQDFIPAPMDVATCMWWTGLDPFSMRPVEVRRRLSERVVQRALMQFFRPENWFVVRKALLDAGRADLIGDRRECLIPSRPPREAIEAKRREAALALERSNAFTEDDGRDAADARLDDHPAANSTYVHAEAAGTSPSAEIPRAKGVGYRPHRAGSRRRTERRGGSGPRD